MPEGQAETTSFEPPQLRNEHVSVRQKLKNLGGRLMQFVKRPMSRQGNPEKTSPPGFLDMEQQRKIEEQKRKEARKLEISEKGCAVRSIMSAVACATGRRDIEADEHEWKAGFLPTDDEWDARLKQIKEGTKSVRELCDDLKNLYDSYKKNDSLLGNALKQVDIQIHENQTEDQIKADIIKGKQILVFTPDIDPQLSHIFHAGLESKRNKNSMRRKIICLSDPKYKKRQYQHAKDLSGKTYTTLSVTLNRNNYELAA